MLKIDDALMASMKSILEVAGPRLRSGRSAQKGRYATFKWAEPIEAEPAAAYHQYLQCTRTH